MTWIAGRTISPSSGELVFTIDEDANLPPSQRWEQLWQVCTGIEPITGVSAPIGPIAYSDSVMVEGELMSHADHFTASAVSPERVMEVAKTDIDPMSECQSYRRALVFAFFNFDVTDDGDAVYETTGCIGSNCDSISIYVRTRGRNPRPGDLHAALGTDMLRAICWNESRWRNFGSNGKPIKHANTNGTADWGLMQINQASLEQQWNWKFNVARGVEILSEKDKAARAYLARHPTDVTTEMIENETIQRYNGGAYYHWNAKTSVWDARPPNNYVSNIRAYMASKPW
jgi:hypothetical protein